MASTLDYVETLELIHCGECGVPFGMSDAFIEERRKDHRTWYCPNGHPRHYPGKTRAEELAEKLETEKRNAEFWRASAKRHEATTQLVRRQRDAYKGHTTRLKKRVAAGRCPCCSTTFEDLAAHMAAEHPEYIEPAPADA